MQPTLLLGTLVTGATASLFAYAGLLTWRRQVPEGSRLANGAFSMWWWGASMVIALLSVSNLLGMAGVVDDDVHTTLHYLRAAPLSLALGCLMFYLAFLFTGQRRLVVPLAGAYLLHHAFTLYYFVRLGPMHTVVTAWDVRVVPETAVDGPLSAAFGIALALPIVAACAAYVVLAFRVGGREQRYRVGLVALALGQWFLLLLVSFLLRLQERDWFSVFYQVPGLVSALFVIVAFRPPPWLQQRLRVGAWA